VAPVSYFFCASAPLVEAANKANAAEAIASRVAITGITSLPLFEMRKVRVAAFLSESSCDLGAIDIILPKRSQQKAPAAKAAGAAALVAIGRR
jgi:hypothetical protein